MSGWAVSIAQDLEKEGLLTPTSLVLTHEVTRDQYEALGFWLGRMHDSMRWAIGDFLLAGERIFGHEAWDMQEALGISIDSKQQYMRVSEAVLPHIRNAKLSWSHHRTLAPLTETEQEVWLEKAEANGWTNREMQVALRAELGPAKVGRGASAQLQSVTTSLELETIAEVAREVFARAEWGEKCTVPLDAMVTLGQALRIDPPSSALVLLGE